MLTFNKIKNKDKNKNKILNNHQSSAPTQPLSPTTPHLLAGSGGATFRLGVALAPAPPPHKIF